MGYHFEISLLWIFFGSLSWLFGGYSFNYKEPKEETLDKLRSEHVKMFVRPPTWALMFLGIPKRRVEVVSTISIQTQIGGLILIFLGVFAGLISTVQLFILGFFFSLFLYAVLPRMLIRMWPQA